MHLHRMVQLCMKDDPTQHTKHSSKAEIQKLMIVSVVVNALLCMGFDLGHTCLW